MLIFLFTEVWIMFQLSAIWQDGNNKHKKRKKVKKGQKKKTNAKK